jgi:V8-like Glu-specific endopeptidase
LQTASNPTPKSVLKGLKSIEPTEEMPVGMRNLLRPVLHFLLPSSREHDLEAAVRACLEIRHVDGDRLVSVSLDADTAKMEFHWPGRRAVTAQRRSPASHARAIDDYRPPWFGASFRTIETAQRSPEPRLFMREKRLKPAQIFNDQRRILTATGWPHHCVGLITNSDGKQGSGTLVGPNLVLTASHVCPWNSINSGQGWWMTFTPHATTGSAPFGQSNVSDILWYRQVGQTADSFESAEDYAVLHLYSRLGDALGWMGGATYNEDWNDRNVWEFIGYPGDFGGNPAVEISQSIEDGDSPGVFGTGAGLDLETEASIVSGASGGPAWAWFQESDRQHARIVGVVSGENFAPADLGSAIFGDTENVLAGGSEMIDLVNQARAAWP